MRISFRLYSQLTLVKYHFLTFRLLGGWGERGEGGEVKSSVHSMSGVDTYLKGKEKKKKVRDL